MKRVIGWILPAVFLFITGGVIGLAIAWWVLPAKVVNTTPETLRQADKDRYRVLIAEDFLVNGDGEKSKVRLALLDPTESRIALSNQVVRGAWLNEKERQALVTLDSAMNGHTGSSAQPTVRSETPFASTQVMPTLTTSSVSIMSPTPDPQKQPTHSSTTTPPGFIILGQTPLCETGQNPRLMVTVVDPSGKPLTGAVIIIKTADSSNRMITGLKPNNSAGVVDFIMTDGIVYSISIEGRSNTFDGFGVSQCTSSTGQVFPGGWFVQIQY
jgi:hypothetical protein